MTVLNIDIWFACWLIEGLSVPPALLPAVSLAGPFVLMFDGRPINKSISRIIRR